MSHFDLSSLRFLVVDDNVHMRRIVRMLLMSYGAREVMDAEDGALALEIFNSQLPDIVIADWSMPVFDGLELTRMLRNTDSSPNAYVPIIMMTGHSERKRVIEARDAGVTEFLCKPISARDLYVRILSAVLKPRPFIKTKNFFGPDRRRFVNPNFGGNDRRATNTEDDPELDAVTEEMQRAG
ncbi:MAG: response regulator [Hyphomicrobiaceae bacterium]|nr:response regulator [Hyphomicrobiaceae bacterium]